MGRAAPRERGGPAPNQTIERIDPSDWINRGQDTSPGYPSGIAGLTVLAVEVAPPVPGGRRTRPVMIADCHECRTRHFFRGELGLRRTPCGHTVLLVEGGGR
jgi:hypothetical protein